MLIRGAGVVQNLAKWLIHQYLRDFLPLLFITAMATYIAHNKSEIRKNQLPNAVLVSAAV